MTYATLRSGRYRLTKQEREDAERQARIVQAEGAKRETLILIILNEAFRRLRIDMNVAFGVRVAEGDPDGAMAAIQLAAFREFLAEELVQIHAATFKASGDAAARVSFFDLGFDVKVEDVLRVAHQRTGTLITRIVPETRRAISSAIRNAIERGDGPRVAAKRLRQHVGLTERRSKALDRLREGLKKQGIPSEKIDRIVARKAQKFLTDRTEMIARTEMLWSSNTAQHEYWIRLMSAGLVPPTSKRVWVVTPDDRLCEQCAPMDGETIEFNDQFVSSGLALPGEVIRPRPQGDVLREYPPLHPMCRCVVSLVVG